MRIINTYDSIELCYRGGNFDIDAWRKYASGISPTLSEKCEQDSAQYDMVREIVPVLNSAAAHEAKMAEASRSFDAVTRELTENAGKLFAEGSESLDLDIILYLGLCSGAGWATTLDGRNAILLGIEKIVELNWQSAADMRGLIFHEVGHIWHYTHGGLAEYPPCASTAEISILQLADEGIAMACEQILCSDPNFYHQDKDDWLYWCRSNLDEIRREYLRRMQNNESTQDFFGYWCSFLGHSDTGYFLGCEFVRDLMKHHTLPEIATMKATMLLKEYEKYCIIQI